jgi:hypothetical protein
MEDFQVAAGDIVLGGFGQRVAHQGSGRLDARQYCPRKVIDDAVIPPFRLIAEQDHRGNGLLDLAYTLERFRVANTAQRLESVNLTWVIQKILAEYSMQVGFREKGSE